MNKLNLKALLSVILCSTNYAFCPDLWSVIAKTSPLCHRTDDEKRAVRFEIKDLLKAESELRDFVSPAFENVAPGSFRIEWYKPHDYRFSCNEEIEMNTISDEHFNKVLVIEFPGGFILMLFVRNGITVPAQFHADLKRFLSCDRDFLSILGEAFNPFMLKLEWGTEPECFTGRTVLKYRIFLVMDKETGFYKIWYL